MRSWKCLQKSCPVVHVSDSASSQSSLPGLSVLLTVVAANLAMGDRRPQPKAMPRIKSGQCHAPGRGHAQGMPRQDANQIYDQLRQERRKNNNNPSYYRVGDGTIILCMEDEIRQSLLQKNDAPTKLRLIINCRNTSSRRAEEACKVLHLKEPFILNIADAERMQGRQQLSGNRQQRLQTVLQKVHGELKEAKTVIIHCKSAVHRAPAVLAILLMFFHGWSFQKACTFVRKERYTEIDRFVDSRRYFDQHLRCNLDSPNNWPWIKRLQNRAANEKQFRLPEYRPAGRAAGNATASPTQAKAM